MCAGGRRESCGVRLLFTGKCLSVLSAEGGTYGGQGEEGDPQEGEAGGQEPPLPGARGLIAVADGG